MENNKNKVRGSRFSIISGLAPDGFVGINLTPKRYNRLLEECKYVCTLNELRRAGKFEEMAKVPYQKLTQLPALCALLDYEGLLKTNGMNKDGSLIEVTEDIGKEEADKETEIRKQTQQRHLNVGNDPADEDTKQPEEEGEHTDTDPHPEDGEERKPEDGGE